MRTCAKSPADRLQSPNDRTLLKAPPQSNKVRVPPSPTSRTRVMIGERRDRGAGPPAEEDVHTPGYSQMSWETTFFVASRVQGRVRATGSPRTRPGGSPDRSGQGAQRVPNARCLPATVDRSPLERTSPRRSTPAVGHSPSGCILARPVAVRRADRSRGPRPFDLWARGNLSSGAASGRPGPGIGRARAVLGRTGLAGRASLVTSSTSGREAVCHRSGGAPGIGQTP